MSDIRATAFEGGIAVTPSDTAIIGPFASLYVGVAGTVTITDVRGNKTSYSGVTAGSRLPVQGTRVWAPGTTASNIVMMQANPIGGG